MGIKHSQYVDPSSFPNDSSKQVSTTAWNENHTIDGDVDFNSNKAVNVTDPTSDQDAATKKYVDDADALKANSSDVYTSSEVDTLLNDKLNADGDTMTNGVIADTNSIRLSDNDTPTVAGEIVAKRSTGFIHFFDGSAIKHHAPNNEEFIAEYDLTGLSYVDIPNLGAFKTLEVSGCVKCGTNGASITMRQSANNCLTFDSGSNYSIEGQSMNYAGSGSSNYGATSGILAAIYGLLNGADNAFRVTIENFNKARRVTFNGQWTGLAAGSGQVTSAYFGGIGSSVALSSNGLRFLTTSGAFTDGYIRIKGIRG